VVALLLCRQVVVRARNLRSNSQYIPAKAFKARKAYYANEVICLAVLYLCSFTKPN
jgi:hypothetical protein